MARTVRDAKLETRAARLRLSLRQKPHWKTLVPGRLHLGYRKKAQDRPDRNGEDGSRCQAGNKGGKAPSFSAPKAPLEDVSAWEASPWLSQKGQGSTRSEWRGRFAMPSWKQGRQGSVFLCAKSPIGRR